MPKTPLKIIKTPVTIAQAVAFAKQRKHHWSGELARAEACVTCCHVNQGCPAECPHL